MLSPEDQIQSEMNRQPVRQTFAYRTTPAARRHLILLQKQQEMQQERNTDLLPSVNTESLEVPNIKPPMRQLTLLREENRRLERELEIVREEMRQLTTQYVAAKSEYEQELAAIHKGQQQEIEQYTAQLQEVIGERNHLKESYFELEQRFQELYNEFQTAVEDEAQKVIEDAAKTLKLTPDEPPALMHDVMKTIELHAQQVEDRQLVEVLHLQREVQRLSDQLTLERQELEQERLQLLRMQQTAREQAELRHKVLQTRLRTRWTLSVVCITTVALILFVLLQTLFLKLDHVPFTAPLDFAIFAPIFFGIIFSFVFAHPISMVRSIYKGAPHKKTVKN